MEKKTVRRIYMGFYIFIGVLFIGGALLAIVFLNYNARNISNSESVESTIESDFNEIPIPVFSHGPHYEYPALPFDGIRIFVFKEKDGSIIKNAMSNSPFSVISKGVFYPSECEHNCILTLSDDENLIFVEGLYSGKVFSERSELLALKIITEVFVEELDLD